jgi:hypothetical protein
MFDQKGLWYDARMTLADVDAHSFVTIQGTPATAFGELDHDVCW